MFTLRSVTKKYNSPGASVLNATLAKETTETSCYAYGCAREAIGPVSIPSIGIEASF